MKLTESQLRSIVREELQHLTEGKGAREAQDLADEIRRMGYEAEMEERSHYGSNVVLMGGGTAPNAVVHFENGRFVVNTGNEDYIGVARKAARSMGYDLVDNTAPMDPTEPTHNAKIRRRRKDRFDREI